MTITVDPAARRRSRASGLFGRAASRDAGGGAPAASPGPVAERLPAVGRRRRPVQAMAGALVLLVCAYVGAQLALRGQPTREVVTLVRPVVAGQALTAGDLGMTRLSGGGVRAFDRSGLVGLVGRRTAVALPAGTLLSNGVLTDAAVPGPGQQVLAMALKAGAFPPGLAPGRAVGVLQVGSATGGPALASLVLAGRARVVAVQTDPGSGVTVVSLALDNARVLDVARAAAAGAVTLSMLPTGL